MGQRRDRLDHRLAKQEEMRHKNSKRKVKEQARRAERAKAKTERLAAKGVISAKAPAE